MILDIACLVLGAFGFGYLLGSHRIHFKGLKHSSEYWPTRKG